VLTARRRKARPERRAFAFQVAVDDVRAAEHRTGEDVPGGLELAIEQSVGDDALKPQVGRRRART
jgi:hypothetical protein